MSGESEIFEQLKNLAGLKTLILGVGQILKGDDGVGPILCQKLSGRISADIMEAGTVPENYIQPIIKQAPENLFVIDAIDFEAEPGTIKVFPAEQLSSAAFSTHTLSPRLFIDLIRRQLDVNVHLIGIQPANLEFGQPLSPPVSEALDILVGLFVKIFPPRRSAP